MTHFSIWIFSNTPLFGKFQCRFCLQHLQKYIICHDFPVPYKNEMKLKISKWWMKYETCDFYHIESFEWKWYVIIGPLRAIVVLPLHTLISVVVFKDFTPPNRFKRTTTMFLSFISGHKVNCEKNGVKNSQFQHRFIALIHAACLIRYIHRTVTKKAKVIGEVSRKRQRDVTAQL